MRTQDPGALANDHLALTLRAETHGGLSALVDGQSQRNLLSRAAQPLFRLTLAQRGGSELELTSLDAERFEWQRSSSPAGDEMALTCSNLGGLDLHITCRVSLPADSQLSRWRISIANRTAYGVRSLIYPVVVTPPALCDLDEEDFYLDPYGQLLRRPRQHDIRPRDPSDWMPYTQYPGPRCAQFVAFYNRLAGLYLAAYDNAGCIKDIGIYRLPDGFDLSIAHHYDETPGLDFELPYDTVLGVFHGDWYDAADLYKQWACRQPWCARKLIDRDDIPAWLKEPRPELITISQGGQERIHGLQSPPSEYPIGRFWPARKAVRLQKEYARLFDTPIVSWMEGWEKIGAPGGPVDIFPPREGEASYTAAMADLIGNGHIPLMYLAGFHWCYKRPMNGYDDWPRFEREGRVMASLDRDGRLMVSNNRSHLYAMGQKYYVQLCVASPELQSLYLDNFARMMDLGAVAVQLDQCPGFQTQVCYSDGHGHPPGYGPWMTASMREFIRQVRSAARARTPDAALSVELCCEFWMQDIDFSMDRAYDYYGDRIAIPLFQYLYHPYTACYSGDGIVNVFHPDCSLMYHARVFTLGIRNTVAYGEEEYNFEINPDYPVLELLRNLCRAQRTFARDYVVFGEMLRPPPLQVAHAQADAFRGEPWEVSIPRVYHSAWRGPDGKIGYVLANWTGGAEEATLTLLDPRGPLVIQAAQGPIPVSPQAGQVTLCVPARSAVVVEQGD